MSVLIYIDDAQDAFNKASLQTITYGVELARKLGLRVAAVTSANAEHKDLGLYGVAKIYHITGTENITQAQLLHTLQQVAIKVAAEVIIFPDNNTAKNMAGALAATLRAGIVTGVIALPDTTSGFVVKKSIYSGKAIAAVKINTPIKIIAVAPHVCPVQEAPTEAMVENIAINGNNGNIKIISKESCGNETTLSTAETVIAGGLGLQGPENWHLVTQLADALHAVAGCSRPVSDNGWRPHAEHVGQTGIHIAPNLYVAVGISGAIQHLGGVNQSKYIVAINKDPDAPIFKVADYGMAGDLFEIVPELTAALK